MTAPEPKPQECWGLYDASGELRDLAIEREALRRVWTLGGVRRFPDNYTIRRVRVEPLSEKEGGE